MTHTAVDDAPHETTTIDYRLSTTLISTIFDDVDIDDVTIDDANGTRVRRETKRWRSRSRRRIRARF